MRALDPRLLDRTRSARPLLVTDVALGVGTAVTVLVQASLLARIVARAFSGGPSPRSGSTRTARVRVHAARRAHLGHGGRRAPRRWSVLSELRLALVERRLRSQPTAADGAESGEIAAIAVQGVDGLEGYFGRYLPQVVLASVVPLLVIAWVALVDLRVGGDHAADAAARAGVHVADRARTPSSARASGGRRCTGSRAHFLDVVRGLPTLRAFNRAHDAGGGRRRGERALPGGDDGRRCG